MYVVPHDMKILCTDEVCTLKELYEKKFGERFVCFNYADFPGSDTQFAAEMYRDALRKAVARDEPTHIVSHRYDTIDH